MSFITGATGSNAFATPIDTSNITVGSESNRVLVAFLAANEAFSATFALTWAPAGPAEAMTGFGTPLQVANREVRGFYLLNPTAATGPVRCVVSPDATGLASGAVIAGLFDGRDQNAPLDFTTATATGTALSVTVPSVGSTDDVMDAFMVASVGGTTVGANQTTIGTERTPADVYWGSYQSGADGGVMSWTAATSALWLMCACRLPAAGGGGGAGPTLPFRTHLGGKRLR